MERATVREKLLLQRVLRLYSVRLKKADPEIMELLREVLADAAKAGVVAIAGGLEGDFFCFELLNLPGATGEPTADMAAVQQWLVRELVSRGTEAQAEPIRPLTWRTLD